MKPVTSFFSLTEEQRACLDLDRSVSVVAGAGSGKTRVLVAQYLHILDSGRADVPHILAITFTEKAAAEMLDRVRQAVADRLAEAHGAEDRQRWARVAESLTEARIQTIHGFCAALLREYPLQAEVDPHFEIVQGFDEEERLEQAVADLLRRRARDRERPLPEALTERWGQADLLQLLLALVRQRAVMYDWARHIEDTDADAIFDQYREEVFQPLRDRLGALLTDSAFEATARRVQELAALPVEKDDKLFEAVREAAAHLAAWTPRLRREGGLPRGVDKFFAVLLTKENTARSFSRTGQAPVWRRAGADVNEAREAMTGLAGWAESIWKVVRMLPGSLDVAMLDDLKPLAELALEAMAAYEQAKGNGRLLDFEDLLIRAARLLEHQAATRRAIASRFPYILVDEFQDTNYLQWRILRLLAEAPGAGRLFIVGDQKQSIYAFRGADVEAFDTASRQLIASGGRQQGLADNFRALAHPLVFCNELFGRLLAGGTHADEPPPQPLRRLRGHDEPGSVELLVVPVRAAGREAEDGESADHPALSAVQAEADLIARRLRLLLDDDSERVWSRPVGEEAPAYRRVQPEDIAILLRRRTHLGTYEDALRRYGVPFTVIAGQGFYTRPEVLDVANLLAFLADPRGEIELAGVLRSALCGITDRGLLQIAQGPGAGLAEKLYAAAREPAGLEAADAAALGRFVPALERWFRLKDRVPLAELLHRIYEETGLWGSVNMGRRGPQNQANLYKLLDLARSFEAGGFRTLRHFVDQLQRQIDAEAQEPEAEVELEGLAGVRVMTIHAAKGLEFPVVVVPDLARRPRGPGAPPIRLSTIQSRAYAAVRVPDPRDNFQMGDPGLYCLLTGESERKERAESKRLFYVACTRARDKLILAGQMRFSKDGAARHDGGTWMGWLREVLPLGDTAEAFEEIASAGQVRLAVSPGHDGGTGLRHVPVRLITRLPGVTPLDQAAEQCLLDRSADTPIQPSAWARAVMASLTPLDQRPVRLVLSFQALEVFRECPMRYYLQYQVGLAAGESLIDDELSIAEPDGDGDAIGRAIGTLVHERLAGALPEGDVAKRLAQLLPDAAVGPAGVAAAVERHVRRFRESPLGRRVQQAALSYGEFPFAVRLDERTLLCGRIDRLYLHDGCWHILDYKTDRHAGPDHLARYREQMRFYALAASGLSERPPAEVHAEVFLTATGEAVSYTFNGAELAAVRSEIQAAADRIRRGEFAKAEDPTGRCARCVHRRQGACRPADG